VRIGAIVVVVRFLSSGVFLTVTPVTFSRHPTNDPRFLISEKRTNRQLSRLLNQKKKKIIIIIKMDLRHESKDDSMDFP
jgi:hypothetical protein